MDLLLGFSAQSFREAESNGESAAKQGIFQATSVTVDYMVSI